MNHLEEETLLSFSMKIGDRVEVANGRLLISPASGQPISHAPSIVGEIAQLANTPILNYDSYVRIFGDELQPYKPAINTNSATVTRPESL